MKKLLSILTLLLIALLSKAQTTVTYSITHDTLERQTIPQLIYLAGYDTLTVTDTTITKYHKSGNFTRVRHVTALNIVPDYDTIASHDTVFICSLCATHDTTIIVNQIDPVSSEYGVFIVNSPQTTLAARIHQAKTIDPKVEWFRYNYNRGDAFYSVKQIQDSGLKCAMTYNWKAVSTVSYFPTGTDLTALTFTLDSLLQIRKPDLLSIENEEGNTSYHKGTVTDYLAELNACAIVAHTYHVPISNGGTTLGIVYALRQWYADNGHADSVAWLNTALSLSPSSSYGTQQLAWYQQLLPGMAALNVDYINWHWYEPPRTDTTPTHSSHVLGPLRNYLSVITGKPDLTTEVGVRNFNNTVLNEEMGESDGAVTIIFYDGTGPLAKQNEQGFKLYLIGLP